MASFFIYFSQSLLVRGFFFFSWISSLQTIFTPLQYLDYSCLGGTPSSIEKDKMSVKMNLHQQDQERVSKITQLASGK